jgi:hypothetical protein
MEFDKKLFEQACRDQILDIVNESKYLREHLPLVEHAKVYDWVKNKASYRDLVSIIMGQDKPASKETINEFENVLKEAENFLSEAEGEKPKKAGILATAGAIALGALITAKAIKFLKQVLDPCIRACKGDQVCIRTCRVNSIKKVVAELQSAKANCANTSKPEKCAKKFDKEIYKWNKKLRQALSVKYQSREPGAAVS